jgi:hypothetical protein
MHQLGEIFFRQYYRVILGERWTVVVCAIDAQGKLVGFHSGTLRAEEYSRALRSRMFSLGLAALPAIFRRPSLFSHCLMRFRSLFGSRSSLEFVVREGPRGEYWAWLPGAPEALRALELHVKWHDVMSALGAQNIRAEVDCENPQILKAAIKWGAQVVRTFKTADGRERWEIEYCQKTDRNS